MRNILKRTAALSSAAVLTAMSLTSVVPAAVTAVDEGEVVFQAECETLEGADCWTSVYENQLPGYSGEGFAYQSANTISFELEVEEETMYDISFRCAQILSTEGRMQTISINGTDYTYNLPYLDEWTDVSFGVFRLKKGVNTIEIKPQYGYAEYDTVTVTKAQLPELTGTGETCDPDATPEAKALMKYLNFVYGEYILSGQQEIYGGGHSVSTSIRYDAQSDKCVDENGNEYEIDRDSKDTDEQGNTFYWHCTGADGQVYTYSTQNHNYGYNDYDQECNYLYDLTGHYPAIRGFDFNCHNPGFAWEDGVADRMISWAKDKNGIVTASWHVTVPKDMSTLEIDDEGNITAISNDWQQFTYTPQTDFVTANCMVEGTKEYAFFNAAVELLAAELTKLQDANVPIIFRPFHEAEGNPGKNGDGSGAWFWWSKEGYQVYNQLWKTLYTKLTQDYGLHNIIWEQNLYAWSSESALWYTGDEWVDIVGFDKYNTVYNRHDGKTSGPNEDAESKIFWTLVDFVSNKKMVSMPENSTIPSMDNMLVEKAMWLYFCTWYDDGDKFISGEDYQNADTVKAVYQSDFCITLDELPADLYSGSSEPGTTTTKTTATSVTTTTTSAVSSGETGGYKAGDANEDGDVNMADAVAIMRAQADPDDFALTAQGRKNADVVGNDGVTNEDALTIQKFEAGIVTVLPVE
ncbi:MAG: beta-mannosidase [Ruminococcus sp.]|nr:beta-mannosidase [Ruminococcus sp.]